MRSPAVIQQDAAARARDEEAFRDRQPAEDALWEAAERDLHRIARLIDRYRLTEETK